MSIGLGKLLSKQNKRHIKFFESLPRFVNRNLLQKLSNVALSLYLFIAILYAKMSRVAWPLMPREKIKFSTYKRL